MQGTHSTCTQHFKLSWRDHVPHKGRSNTPEQHVFRMRSCLHCQCNEGFCLLCRLLKTLPFEAIIWPYPCMPASASLVLAQPQRTPNKQRRSSVQQTTAAGRPGHAHLSPTSITSIAPCSSKKSSRAALQEAACRCLGHALKVASPQWRRLQVKMRFAVAPPYSDFCCRLQFPYTAVKTTLEVALTLS